jgi:sigma-54 dependent transcriptional regulator, acetoin dehydrogenase operon transcriptional activator AcoR
LAFARFLLPCDQMSGNDPVQLTVVRARQVEVTVERPLESRYDFSDIAGASGSLRRVVELARVAARNDLPVVLEGESGTGKELFAHAIHAASRRATGPFVVVNCGSIPAELIEAELFGYEPGAFTGARKGGASGRFEDANGGTIFLDEVCELPMHAQVALLRVLQEREVVRVGASAPRPIDARVIAASNRPLEEETRQQRFRLDLYFRLCVLKVAIPPLRQRADDLVLLARRFLTEAERELDRPGLSLAPDALAVLKGHRWTGNVRELKNVLLRAASTAPAEVISARDISLDFSSADPRPVVALPRRPSVGTTLRDAVLNSEKMRVRDALAFAGGNVARAAQQLGVSRMTLYRLMHKVGVTRSSDALAAAERLAVTPPGGPGPGRAAPPP